MTRLRRRLLPLLATLLLLAAPLASSNEGPEPITAAQFGEDITFIRATIKRMHPDPAFSSDPRAVESALDQLGQGVPPLLTRDEAWQRLASLNPLFADAHFFIGYPDWRGETRSWLDGGGALFPVEVEIGADDSLFMRPETPSAARMRILAVNGVDVAILVPALLAKVHGDTPAFRRNLLARRWWLFYWKTFGAPTQYRLSLEQAGVRRTVDLPGSRGVPRVLLDEAQFNRQFALGFLPGGTAVLTVSSFSQADPALFLAFTRDAFARIRKEGATTLVIDISRNEGGDDGMWIEGLMPYLATVPYRTGSTYRGIGSPQSDTPGQPIKGEISTWRQPQADNPLRFTGKVQVRIGPGTYSSAILFANVMRDFGLATLVGRGGAARQSQSGGVRNVRLPHTGLIMALPRFIIDPPAGSPAGALLEAEAAPDDRSAQVR